ncbi:hypothetical protein [Novosphingobium clariflavum]|uniref:Uncharacterized protein n=1 Tax=Novosphingobium clariflavum TaxID=2029884 RepID=A0ABV6SEC1_9SPHN|nr:hypothetical protein [Novosphingobium clariflavum]
MVFEFAKLLFQFGGAVLIAWLAVRWALARYKSEKLWDRRLAAYADVISAVAELERLNELWFEEALGSTFDEETTQEQIASYTSARRRVRDALAVGWLIMPSRSQNVLNDLQRWFDRTSRVRGPSDGSIHLEEGALVGQALIELKQEGRRLLEINEDEHGG